MKSVAQAIERLIQQQVDSGGWVEEYDAQGELSPFLTGSFDIYRAEMFGREVFFAEPAGDVEDYGMLRRQLDQLTGALMIPPGERVILYIESLPSSVRRSFLESGTPFVTASGDFNLPFLSFRINALRHRPLPVVRSFRGSDQSVYLFGLYTEGSFSQEDVMRETGLSVGSVSRALSNLVAARVLDFEVAGRTGRKKAYFRTNDLAYYQAGVELFGDPVQNTTYTDALPQGVSLLVSGLSALALRSDLLMPSKEVWAVGPSHAGSIVPIVASSYRGLPHAIQVLRYDPEPFARDERTVDPFTMLMTIPKTDRSDERVRIALRQAMEGCAWYQD